MASPRRTLRRLASVALFLILGAIADIPIAWSIALWTSTGPLNSVQPPSRSLEKGEPFEWPFPAPTAWGAPIAVAWSEGFGIDWQAASKLPPGSPDAQTVFGFRAGWPFRTMMCYEQRVQDSGGALFSKPSLTGGIVLPGRLNSAMWRVDDNHRRLPLMPVWPGFLWGALLNALAFWFLLALIPRAVRFTRSSARVRRNACAACGYPRGASPQCAECGALTLRTA